MNNINNSFGFITTNPKTIYFDSASTTLRHMSVVDGVNDYVNNYGVNLGRSFGIQAGALATKVYNIRTKISGVYGCKNFFFCASATDGFNHVVELLIKNKIIQSNLTPFENIVLGIDNHHASILPFYNIGFGIEYINLDNELNLDFEEFDKMQYKPAVIALTMTSNVTGSEIAITNIKKLRSQFPNTVIILDCTQYWSYSNFDFDELGIDFAIGSFHKMYGASGLGIVMYNNKYKNIKPVRVGGGIIKSVTTDDVTYCTDGTQFEAGTINLDAIVGVDKLLDFLVNTVYIESNLDFGNIYKLQDYEFYSNPNSKKIISFKHKTKNNFDLANYLALNNMIVRVGHHCCNPLMDYLQLEDGLVRVSVGVYNTQDDIDKLCAILAKY